VLDPVYRSVIAHFRKSPNWDEHLDLELLQKLWPALVGEHLGRLVQVTALRGSTVVVNVPDLVWRRQLMGMKPLLLQKINELWGSPRILQVDMTYEDQ
jgi:predicted nucleic acid-binding Zn ribbon protein